ncbi:MAG: antifreeze protein [Yoonia sp.]|nr:antifreeze protein [Yoonia sp.]
MTPEQMLKLNASFTTLMMDTHAVMSIRMMGMMGATPAHSDENTRIVSEKAPAFAEAMKALTTAALSGYRPDQIMAAGMEPLQREVSSNRARLEK